MKVQIARPRNISPERLEELKGYLVERWQRSVRGRADQVDGKYKDWSKAYRGRALEQVRTVPFYKSSNFVVKLIRMFVDTFTARTLNIIYATEPIFVVTGLPRDLKDSWEAYLNSKCVNEWDFYNLTRNVITRGNKNGTNVTKTPWVEELENVVSIVDGTQQVSTFTRVSRPQSKCIPFEDFYIYPIVANELSEADILFHRIRLSEERVRQRLASKVWQIPENVSVESLVEIPRDAKKMDDQNDAGVVDPYYKEGEFIECHLKWSFDGDDSNLFNIVAVLHLGTNTMPDLFYNPYPRNACIFDDYRPFPQEELFWGESMSEVLAQSQEEASQIHNDRRNNVMLANSTVFKRRNGANVPNPSTNWYPGKVFDLDDLDDLEVIEIGRNFTDMIQEENLTFSLAEKLSGINDVMQGASQGNAERGIYNTMGTMAVLQEGNQRQDTNIRDVRNALSRIGCLSSMLQATYGQDDPYIRTLAPDDQTAVRQVFSMLRSDTGNYVRLQVKTSDAGVNKQVERANLMQIAQLLGTYGQTVIAMAQQLARKDLNPSIRMIMNEVVVMQKWLATRLLREFDEHDAESIVPDLGAAIEASIPGGSSGAPRPGASAGEEDMDNGGASNPPTPLTRGGLEAISSLPTLPAGSFGAGNMAQ